MTLLVPVQHKTVTATFGKARNTQLPYASSRWQLRYRLHLHSSQHAACCDGSTDNNKRGLWYTTAKWHYWSRPLHIPAAADMSTDKADPQVGVGATAAAAACVGIAAEHAVAAYWTGCVPPVLDALPMEPVVAHLQATRMRVSDTTAHLHQPGSTPACPFVRASTPKRVSKQVKRRWQPSTTLARVTMPRTTYCCYNPTDVLIQPFQTHRASWQLCCAWRRLRPLLGARRR